MVAEPARGAGVGRQLMAAAEAWARRRGARYVALATGRAAPFYQALGYEDSAASTSKNRSSSPDRAPPGPPTRPMGSSAGL